MRCSIRRGTFETNSSSVHAVCIADEPDAVLGGTLTGGEFGWGSARADAADYLWQAIWDNYHGSDPERFAEWEDAIREECGYDVRLEDASGGYVDHAYEMRPLLDAMLGDRGLLRRMLSSGSYVVTGDDCGDGADIVYSDEPHDDDGVGFRLDSMPGFMIYKKGN